MIRSYIAICIGLVLLTAATHIQTPSYHIDPCDGTTSGLIDAERLVYTIYYNYRFAWIPAGEVVFETTSDDDYYLVEVTGKTYPAYNTFFKVDDYFATKVDKASGLPAYFVRRVQEGSYRKYDSLAFDQLHLSAVSYVGKSRATVQEDMMKFSSCMHDMLSIVYQMRALDFDTIPAGAVIPYEVAFDGETYDLALAYKGLKRKKLKKLGRRDTYMIEPQVVAGAVFDEMTTMTIYTSADQLKIPLMVESPVSIGSVKAVLQE